MKALDPTQVGTEAEKLSGGLHRRIVGQDEAIDTIVSAYQTYVAGMNGPGRTRNRPAPSGVRG